MNNMALRALIVADIEYQEVYSDILRSDGFQVAAAGSYEEAEGILHRKSFDIVIVSIPLRPSPDEGDDYDARRLFREIRSTQRRDTSIIILGDPGEPEVRRMVYGEDNVSDVIAGPPVDGRQLLASIHRSFLRPLANSSPAKSARSSDRNDVEFTSFYPSQGNVETWHTLLVYIHLITAMRDVLQDARRFEDKLPMQKQVRASASTPILRGTEITIVPSCEGIEFNPPRATVKWMEDFHRADFRFRADRSLLDDAAKGHITFFVGPVIVGTLKFAMLFNDKSGTPALGQGDWSTMYHSDRIFISYSHKDTDIALLFRNVLEATGYDVLIDVDDLRAGQVWNEQLMRMIERADIFQLFWSSNSCQSEYCRQEWEHALKQNKGEGYIRPVYWQKPLSPPPQELSKFHFDYIELKIPTALGD